MCNDLDRQAVAKAIRDNLALLAFLVVLVGTSSTEAYYATFGLRYQYLSLSADHVLFRGLTVGFSNPTVWIIYFVCVIGLAGQSPLVLALGGLSRARLLLYALVVAVVAAAWVAGSAGGRSAALADGTESRSALPKVLRLEIREGRGITDPLEGERLLMQSSAGLFLVRPVRDRATETPFVRFVPGGNINALSLCSSC
jgi:hypothetical protein